MKDKEEKNNLSRKLYNFFNSNRDGKGVSKDEKPFVPNLKSMPKFYFRNFNRLLSLNILMILLVIPAIIAVYIYINSGTTPSQESTVFSTLYGSNLLRPSASLQAFLGIFGQQLDLHVLNVGQIYTLIALAVITLLLWGFVHVGAAYCTRSMLRQEPVFIFSDFFYAIKRNWKQGFLMGIIDALIVVILTIDILYCSQVGGSFWLDLMFFTTCALCIIYFFMRFYIYLMLVTFDLSIRKIYKNALIFSILGIKRNLMSVLGIAALVGVNVLLFIVLRPFNLTIPLILPFFYLFPSITLLTTYGAYPVIEKYMITTVTDSGDDSGDEDDVKYRYVYDEDEDGSSESDGNDGTEEIKSN